MTRARHRSAPGRPTTRKRAFAKSLATLATVGGMALTMTPASTAAPVSAHPAATHAAVTAPEPWQPPRLTMLVEMAREMTTMDIPYSYGGHGPQPAAIGESVDCSGLVRQLYDYAFGVDIGRGKGDWMVRTSGLFTRTNDPVPGDVILFGHGGYAPAFHAMIYVGQDDAGRPSAIGSPNFGYTVMYQRPWIPYWAGDLMGYWHFNGATAVDSGPLTPPDVQVDVTDRSQRGNRVTLSGYAYDPTAPAEPVSVALRLGGKTVQHRQSTEKRADGKPGFTFTFRSANGGRNATILAKPLSGSDSHQATTGSCAPFPDVQSHNDHCWNVTWLKHRNITKPADNHYRPAATVTRGAMAAFLYRLTHPGRAAPDCTRRPFPDVPVSGTFCGYIAWAKSTGVAVGYSDGHYGPDNAVTRGAMAAYLHRLAHDKPAPDCTSKPFDDVSGHSTFCGVITWMKRAGITYGVGDHRYGTTEPVTRQAMASFLHRMDGVLD